MKNIYCFSESNFNKTCNDSGWNTESAIPEDYRIISISGASDCEHRFHETPGKILNVDFDDISVDSTGSGQIGISDQDAERIVNFITSGLDKNFVIHCSAGRSRSQAVVRFMLDTWPHHFKHATELDNPCNTPNYFVYRKLIKTFNRGI